ncbi:MAG TPA: PaaI family thioesterase [Pyrinomonadaceae bacterium]|nr:PaaI family thioesterase [Pyrinomonadaceae bacterium]
MNEAALTSEELARLQAAFAQVAYARLLGLELVEVARGTAVLSLTVRPELTRMEGIMHGGALASLMDTASAFAVLTLLAPAEQTVTVDLTIHFLRPVSSGRVQARAHVLRAGRRLVTVAIEATNEAEELVATALTTYAIRR